MEAPQRVSCMDNVIICKQRKLQMEPTSQNDVEAWTKSELQANAEALKQEAARLQGDLTKLQRLLALPLERWDDISTLESWIDGNVAQRTTRLASRLARQWGRSARPWPRRSSLWETELLLERRSGNRVEKNRENA